MLTFSAGISRIEAGIVQIERELVDIKSVIARATDTLEPQAREKEISLHIKLADVDLTVDDPGQVERLDHHRHGQNRHDEGDLVAD